LKNTWKLTETKTETEKRKPENWKTTNSWKSTVCGFSVFRFSFFSFSFSFC